MKGFDKKGISPVIATILLIALTVAAVGIVAVIVSGYAPTGRGINVTLTYTGLWHPAKGGPDVENVCTLELMNWGPDAVIDGSVSIEFEGLWQPTGTWARGFVEKIGQTGKGPSWVTGVGDNKLEVSMWPWKISSGANVSINFRVTAGAKWFRLTSIAVKDVATGRVLYQNTTLPAPSPP